MVNASSDGSLNNSDDAAATVQVTDVDIQPFGSGKLATSAQKLAAIDAKVDASSDGLLNNSDDAAATVQATDVDIQPFDSFEGDVFSKASAHELEEEEYRLAHLNRLASFNAKIDAPRAGSLNNIDDAAATAQVTDADIQPFDRDKLAISQTQKVECASTEEPNHFNMGLETTPSKLARLMQELEEAIQVKNFAMAGNIQTDIERLEKNQLPDDIGRITQIKSEFNKELTSAVEAKDFAKAAHIQQHIESLEKGALSGTEASALLKKSFDTELSKAIEAKDFAMAGKIQARIESLEQTCNI